MTYEDPANTNPEENSTPEGFTLKLGQGAEFAEFTPALLRLTFFHVLGTSRLTSLGYAEACILNYLGTHPGEIITRQELIDHAWKDRVVSQGSLNQAISTLRGLLSDDQKQKIILTVPRRGYQLNSESLVPRHEWLTVKEKISNQKQIPTELPAPSAVSTDLRALHNRYSHAPTLWTLIAILLLTFLAGLGARLYYKISPPYVIEHFSSKNTVLSVVAKDRENLNTTVKFLQPLFRKIEALGAGRALISKNNNNIEIHCIRTDKTVHTLYIHVSQTDFLSNDYLNECLK